MTRSIDPIWEALVDVANMGTISDIDRGQLNKARKCLKQKGATSEQIYERAKAYKARWPNVAFTVMALAKNWDQFKPRAAATAKPMCPACHHEIVQGECYGCTEQAYARRLGR